MKIPNTIVKIRCEDTLDLFKRWLLFTLPYHNLSEKERDVTAAFLNIRYRLSKSILDNSILDAVVMGDDAKKEVMEVCGINMKHFQVMLTKLRKKNIIVDNRLSPNIIPALKDGNINNYMLMYVFTIEERNSTEDSR